MDLSWQLINIALALGILLSVFSLWYWQQGKRISLEAFLILGAVLVFCFADWVFFAVRGSVLILVILFGRFFFEHMFNREKYVVSIYYLVGLYILFLTAYINILPGFFVRDDLGVSGSLNDLPVALSIIVIPIAFYIFMGKIMTSDAIGRTKKATRFMAVAILLIFLSFVFVDFERLRVVSMVFLLISMAFGVIFVHAKKSYFGMVGLQLLFYLNISLLFGGEILTLLYGDKTVLVDVGKFAQVFLVAINLPLIIFDAWRFLPFPLLPFEPAAYQEMNKLIEDNSSFPSKKSAGGIAFLLLTLFVFVRVSFYGGAILPLIGGALVFYYFVRGVEHKRSELKF